MIYWDAAGSRAGSGGIPRSRGWCRWLGQGVPQFPRPAVSPGVVWQLEPARQPAPFPAPVPPVPPAQPGPGEPALPSHLWLELLLFPWGLISCCVPIREGPEEEEEEDEDTRGQSLALLPWRGSVRPPPASPGSSGCLSHSFAELINVLGSHSLAQSTWHSLGPHREPPVSAPTQGRMLRPIPLGFGEQTLNKLNRKPHSQQKWAHQGSQTPLLGGRDGTWSSRCPWRVSGALTAFENSRSSLKSESLTEFGSQAQGQVLAISNNLI